MKNEANENNIHCVNEGLGSVILKVVENSKKQNRININRNIFLEKHGKICRGWNLESESLEIDHIIPLVCGGSNKEQNLQILCTDCHKKKTEYGIKGVCF